MSQLRKLNQTQTKEKGVAVVTPQRSYSNLLEDLIKDIVASQRSYSNLLEDLIKDIVACGDGEDLERTDPTHLTVMNYSISIDKFYPPK